MPTENAREHRTTPANGPWDQRTPSDVAALLATYRGNWWIAGGWAIEAFTGTKRLHSDVDPSIPRAELPRLRQHLAGRMDLWAAADQETLRLLRRESIGDDQLPDGCENVWARTSDAQPWEYDIILMNTTSGIWTFKRDARIRRPISETVWSKHGIKYLRPEVQLLHKARGLRARDQADFDATWPLLDADGQGWLRDALRIAEPEHPWLAAM